ncbi:unnamed protein product [Periconia digitata]|uniref:Uncharacterized protein n=1 Tax=Periconia digitata TaxID=1303443 RepID=A0A9W4U108_9PLEO|nr:unnamed protein product [Periconia digitata]
MANTMPLLPPFSESSALSSQRLATVLDSNQTVPVKTSDCSSRVSTNGAVSYLPGEPSVALSKAAVGRFLVSELSTPVLDQLYNHLWFVARRSGQSIDSLHKQKIKGRSIIPTEDPHLHLVWHRDKTYVKPMPEYLLNYHFWTAFLSTSPDNKEAKEESAIIPEFDRATALGFMRSYSYLVQHRVDLILARESHLLPVEIDWIQWSEFIANFRQIEDYDVSKRYHYGQLRLSRLDWAVRLFRPSSAATKWFYEIPHWSIGIYVERSIAPLLFGFASFSLVLSSMQVLLAVPDEGLKLHGVGDLSLVYMRRAFWVFSIIVLLLSGVAWILLCVIPFTGFMWQILWGFRNRDKPSAYSKGAA